MWYTMCRSIWLPTNYALALSMACGVAGSAAATCVLSDADSMDPSFALIAALACFVSQRQTLALLRLLDEYSGDYSEDECDDRRAISLSLLASPGAMLCGFGWLVACSFSGLLQVY